MQSSTLTSFLVSHPKLFEFVLAGATAMSFLWFQLQGVTGNPGP